ncbi:hypothetical protein AWENTII_000479 [Aspergillus wentii]
MIASIKPLPNARNERDFQERTAVFFVAPLSVVGENDTIDLVSCFFFFFASLRGWWCVLCVHSRSTPSYVREYKECEIARLNCRNHHSHSSFLFLRTISLLF